MLETCSCSGWIEHADPSYAGGTSPLPLHIALTTKEGSKPATEEPLLLILSPYFSSLNSLIVTRKSNIGYSVFPFNSLSEEELPLCPPSGNTHLSLGTDEPGLWEETSSSTWMTPAFSSQRSSEVPFAPWSHFFTAENIAAKTLFLLQSKCIWHSKMWSRYNWQHTDSWMISSYLQLFFNCKEVSQYTAEHLLISTIALFLLLTLPTPPPLPSLTTVPETLTNCKLSVTCGVGFILCILMHFSKNSSKK